jgi:hypothetical protein
MLATAGIDDKGTNIDWIIAGRLSPSGVEPTTQDLNVKLAEIAAQIVHRHNLATHDDI